MDKFEKNREKNEIINEVLRSLTMALAVPDFSGVRGGVPVELVAEIMGKKPDYVKQGIKEKWLSIGIYAKTADKEEYYISPKLLWELTGYVYQGKKGDDNYGCKDNLSKPVEKSERFLSPT